MLKINAQTNILLTQKDGKLYVETWNESQLLKRIQCQSLDYWWTHYQTQISPGEVGSSSRGPTGYLYFAKISNETGDYILFKEDYGTIRSINVDWEFKMDKGEGMDLVVISNVKKLVEKIEAAQAQLNT